MWAAIKGWLRPQAYGMDARMVERVSKDDKMFYTVRLRPESGKPEMVLVNRNLFDDLMRHYPTEKLWELMDEAK